jgi:hypothetical protein
VRAGNIYICITLVCIGIREEECEWEMGVWEALGVLGVDLLHLLVAGGWWLCVVLICYNCIT